MSKMVLKIVLFSQAMVAWVHGVLKDNVKVQPLQEISSSCGFIEKTTVQRKLLSSLIYDLAKQFAISSFDSRNDRKLAFNVFWAFFPNFDGFENDLCSFKEEQVSFKNMCSKIFTTNVSYTLNRMMKIAK